MLVRIQKCGRTLQSVIITEKAFISIQINFKAAANVVSFAAAFSLSRNPVAGQAATGFLVVIKIKIRSSKGKWEFIHFHFANFLRFMAANLSFTQFVT